MNKRIWVTWENQRRNRSMSKVLDAKLFQFDLNVHRAIRYPILIFKTLATFIKEKPNLLLVQNPSIVLALISVTYGKITNIPVVVDTHNAGIFPFGGGKWWANLITIYIFKLAKYTIVTNDALAQYVRSKGGRPFVFPDPIQDFAIAQKDVKKLKGSYNILFICSWASDEPYNGVISAARHLSKDIVIYMTGENTGNKEIMHSQLPANVILTGYLSHDDFISMLFSCDVVMDLTMRENCLVCGAYEAISAEQPLILSDTKALKKYFFKGCLFTNNQVYDIVDKINQSISNKELLKAEIKKLKKELIDSWQRNKERFEQLIRSQESANK